MQVAILSSSMPGDLQLKINNFIAEHNLTREDTDLQFQVSCSECMTDDDYSGSTIYSVMIINS